MAGFVDVHNHLIPGVDDGARDLDDSLALARGLHALGFEGVVTTPHVHPPRWDQDPEDLAARLEGVVDALDGDGPRLAFAAENFLDDEIWTRFRDGTLIRYPGGQAALVEFSSARSLPPGYQQRFFEMSVSGLTPVLAHPERYGEICDDLDVAEKLVNGGVVLLVSLTSFARSRFFDVHARRAEALVREGLSTAAASDLHDVRELPVVEKGMKRLRKLVGDDGLQTMLIETQRGFVDLP